MAPLKRFSGRGRRLAARAGPPRQRTPRWPASRVEAGTARRAARLVAAAVLGLAAQPLGPARAAAPPAFDPLVLRIEMREYAFQPARLVLPAGRPVRLIFRNSGQIAHQFESPLLQGLPATIADTSSYAEVRGVELLRVAPGAEARLDFRPLRSGRFAFACTIEGHREAGMTGTLEVVRQP